MKEHNHFNQRKNSKKETVKSSVQAYPFTDINLLTNSEILKRTIIEKNKSMVVTPIHDPKHVIFFSFRTKDKYPLIFNKKII